MNGSPSESIEVEALLATSILDADNVPNKNQSETCFSCGSEMVGLFCKDCGQKNDNLRRSIFSLILEAFTSIFSLESRMWKTWLSLFIKPGQASREFADGKRALWTSPVRIYLAMSIILFGYMSLTDTRLISVRSDIVPQKGIVGNVADLDDTQTNLKPQVLFFTRQKTIDELNKDVDFERVERMLNGAPRARFSLTEETEPQSQLNIGTHFDQSPEDIAEEIAEEIAKTFVGEDPVEDLSEDVVETLQELSEETQSDNGSQTDGVSLTDEEIEAKERQEEALEKSEDAIDGLNTLLGNYINMQDVASGLSDGSISLTAEALIKEFPSNFTREEQALREEEARKVISELEAAGITQDTIGDLHLRLYQSSGMFFNNLTLNGRKIDPASTRAGAMKLLKQPALLNEAFATYLPRIMFFMMPFAMFTGIIYIRGRKTALMYDHLVHAAYIHAFTYLFLLILIILSQWTPLSGLGKVFFWGMVIYLPISAKRMFKRGWFKTIWMTYNIAFSYSVTIFFIMLGLLVTQLDRTVIAV